MLTPVPQRKWYQAAILVCWVGSFMPAPALAEPPDPASSSAEVIEKKIREEAQKKIIEPAKIPEIEKEPVKEVPEAQGEVKFLVRKIEIRGNYSVKTEELRPLLAHYEGREITLTEANQLAAEIERAYRNRGYITSIAYIPPQKVEHQLLIVQVLEGKFGKLRIEGNKWFSEGAIRRYWRIDEGETLRYQDLEKNIQRMNDNPDRRVKAVLRPGEETGYTDVYVKVKDRFPGHAGFLYDNQGLRATGHRRYGTTARYNNFIFPDGILFGGVILGKDFGAVFTQYLVPINSYGTKLISGFTHSQVSPKRELKGSDVNGRAETYTLGLRQALFEERRFQGYASLGFDFKDSRTKDITGTRRRDRLRVLRPGLDFSESDAWGNTTFSNEFSLGINALGATDSNNPFAGRAGADPNFKTYEGSLTRNLKFPYETQLTFKFAAQVSLDKLTPQEELYIGGANTVRGYPEGDYLADQGIITNVEYMVPTFFFPEDLKLLGQDMPLRKQVQMIFFFDQGYGKLRGASRTEMPTRHLIGAGGGLIFQLSKYISAEIEFAHALGQEPITESDHTRFHFQLHTNV